MANSLLLLLQLLFPSLFLSKVLRDPPLFLPLRLTLSGFQTDLFCVRKGNVFHQTLRCCNFTFSFHLVFLPHFVNVLQHRLLFLLLQRNMSQPVLLPLLDLCPDNHGSLATIFDSLFLTFFVHFQCLQTFHLHHHVKLPFPRLLYSFNLTFLVNLGITNGDTLRVVHHLIHCFYLISTFVLQFSRSFDVPQSLLLLLYLLRVLVTTKAASLFVNGGDLILASC
mmetsp:Transcript_88604/g.147186  ORF Transcript_88604/g.147186 Transcript_88604/m.147186 type:complete len:223 (+) Transcript_88604:2045-2713(+)